MSDLDRIQTPGVVAREDEALDVSLRPRRLEEFVGQEALKTQLSIAIQAAGNRGEALDHVLLAGPPGLGKTSLAQIVAAELEVDFVQTAGPALERKADIAAFLTALEPRSVFFVDEIHRLPRAVEETFYPAMEDSQLPITVGAGAGARVVTLELPPFTLIGATTRAGLLTTPLRDRFGLQHRLEHYGPGDLARIVVRSARVLGIEIESAGARAIAERARGTPRVANRLLKRVRDFAEVHRGGRIDAETASAALDMLEVDHEGLDRLDREILGAICGHFGGGPVGLSTLAVAVGEEQDTIEDVYEPYLLQRGLIKRTPRGRCATARALPASRAHAAARGREPLLAFIGASYLHPSTLPPGNGAPVHLPQLRSSLHGDGAHRRLPQHPQGLLEVRLRVPLRAARRLLPRSQRGLLRLRPGGPDHRLRARIARAHRPLRREGHRPPGAGGARPRLRRTGTTPWAPCSSGASASWARA